MPDNQQKISEIEEVPEGASFIRVLAQYYSDFLSTDFKKGRLPKRQFLSKDKKGRRAGIPIEKFPTFLPSLKASLSKEFGKGISLNLKLGSHKSQLSAVTVKSIDAIIQKIDVSVLQEKNAKSANDLALALEAKDVDLELIEANFINDIKRNVGIEVAAKIIFYLQPVFEKSATNLLDTLISVEDELVDILTSQLEEAVPGAIASLVGDSSEAQLEMILEEAFEEESLRDQLSSFFNDFSAGDLFSELRELVSVESLDENLEFYLYLGEIKHQNHTFPIFYIPLQVSLEGSRVAVSLEPRILVNKKAIDFVTRIIQEENKVTRASSVKSRIMYVNEDQSIFDVVDGVLQDILLACEIEGSLSFFSGQGALKNSIAKVNTDFSIALFDKSDESMLTDYEDLLHNLDNGSELLDFLEGLVDGFLDGNPLNIIEAVLDEWDETEIPERLVIDTPLPLAEEQRKILSALNNPKSKFVTVEGPPGTGKSHTISAIAFGAILKGQSILVLSDKKEALDVVENKLNETLSKVRPSDDFINPILRLGRAGSNFTKLTTTKSIESLRTQHREIVKEKGKRADLYKKACGNLKAKISGQIESSSKIDVNDILRYEKRLQAFRAEYEEIEGLTDLLDGTDDERTEGIDNIYELLSVRAQCRFLTDELLGFSESFGDDAIALGDAIEFVELVNKLEAESGVFVRFPRLTFEGIRFIGAGIDSLKEAKGIFGYIFSGKKIAQAKDDLRKQLGFVSNSRNAVFLVSELEKFQTSARVFYDDVSKYQKEMVELVPATVGIEIGIADTPPLIEALRSLQEIVDDECIPLLGEEETLVEILTSEQSGEAAFYEEFAELTKKSVLISESLQFEDYNYLARKTELENYNALELASAIDERVINFATDHKNDARTLGHIIRGKKKFPKDKFDLLRSAFPCMICGLRDYAEYIPLEKELFDIIIIDEASQVSIAQALPAIIRAKKMIVLGDRRQFGNVKTSNASKELNTAYFNRVKQALAEEWEEVTPTLDIRASTLNISNSILDFMEGVSNFNIMLKKHFRGYPEMISFSSKYFYGNSLQPMKIRGKPIDDVLEFQELTSDGLIDLHQNTNEPEAEYILGRLLDQLDTKDFRSVAIITPFTQQQTYISKKVSDHARYQEFVEKLRFRCFTFDSCQGEERDIIYYSFVATAERDRLWAIFPRALEEQSEEELDRNKKMQRLNVGFSRGKEKLVFVYSKPISSLKSALREVLNHYSHILSNAKEMPSEDDVDPKSEAEKKVLQWLHSAPVINEFQPEIVAQFKIGEYLKSLDPSYSHPAYRVDFLLRFSIDGNQRDIILEYDGFEYHFDNRENIDEGNWRHYQKAGDVERERILESYGYKTLRINKFNAGMDPIQTLSDRIFELLEEFSDPGDALIKAVLQDTMNAHEGLKLGKIRHCKKCDQNKPIEDFLDASTKRGTKTYCNSCSPIVLGRKKKSGRGVVGRIDAESKACPTCKKIFPNSEFVDFSNASGRRRLCGNCKKISDRKREQSARRWSRRGYRR